MAGMESTKLGAGPGVAGLNEALADENAYLRRMLDEAGIATPAFSTTRLTVEASPDIRGEGVE